MKKAGDFRRRALRTTSLSRWILPLLAILIAGLAGRSIARIPLRRTHPLVLGASGLILCAVFLRPQLGTWVMLATLILSTLFPFEGGLTLNRALGVATLGGIIAQMVLRSDRGSLVIGRFDHLCWGFLFVILSSILANRFYPRTEGQLWNLLMGYLLYWLLVNTVDSWQKLKTTLAVIAACTLILALSAIATALTFVNPMTRARFSGIREVGATGLYSYVGSMVTLWLSEGARGGKRVLLYLLLPVFLVAMFLSGNRSGWIALIVSLLLLALHLWRSERKTGLVLLLVALVVASGVLVASFAPRPVARLFDIPIQQIVNPVGEDTYLRVFLVRAAWRMFADRPILGVGFGGYSTRFKWYEPTAGRGKPPPHNVFIGTLAETGALGAALLLLIYGQAFRSLRRARPSASTRQDMHAAVYVLILLAGVNVVDAMFHANYISRTMFVFFALSAVVSNLVRDPTKNGSPG